MRTQLKSRRVHPQSSEGYYDLFDDWELVESSFLKQYGIRIRQDDDMSWSEFCSLLSGLMADTPLGQVVAIRSEKDMKVIQKFNKEQKRIYNQWKTRRMQEMKKDKKAYMDYWLKVQQEFKKVFSKQ